MILNIENNNISLFSLMRFFALHGYVLQTGEGDSYNVVEMTSLEDMKVESEK